MWKSILSRDRMERINGGHQWKRHLLLTVVLCAASCVGWMLFSAIGGEALEAVEAAEVAETDITESPEILPGWSAYADEPVTLNWYINYSWFTTGWGENAVSQKITEETGVTVNFVTPAGTETEKLAAMISANSLPDIITLGWWETQLDEMITKDLVYALNELAEEYEPYFFTVADDEVVAWYQKEDGNLYCYPNSTYTPSDYEECDTIGSNQTFLVRKDIYEAIGSPDMSTPEGFMEAVRMAAELFPEVDGEPLIPVGADVFTTEGCNSFDLYLQNFLAIPYEDENGIYYDRYTDEEYITWLKVFRQLNEEGYLSTDIFIDQRTQMEEKIAQGRYFCMLYQRTDMEDQEKYLYANDPDSIYIAVDGPANSAGDDPVLPGAGLNGWTVTLISKNCQDPERAIELLTYLMSEEGQLTTYLGVEGVTYDVADGDCVVREEVQELLNTDRTAYDRLYGADNAYWMLQNNVLQLKWKQSTDASEDPCLAMEEWTYPYTQYLGQYELSFSLDTDVGYSWNAIQELWGDTLPELLLAESEEAFDEILAAFVEERDALGYDEVVLACTEKYRAAKERLGME
ncbi:MAG: extracellular solute-binding protein [Lachnospiraceae bacterium]|nr:extracellular solute-binding protein [Lachnospiraceae bacterium]